MAARIGIFLIILLLLVPGAVVALCLIVGLYTLVTGRLPNDCMGELEGEEENEAEEMK